MRRDHFLIALAVTVSVAIASGQHMTDEQIYKVANKVRKELVMLPYFGFLDFFTFVFF